jgi:hypothetical protein
MAFTRHGAEFFQSKLVDSLLFLESLSIKDGADKDTFFRRLPTQLDTIPSAIAKQKVLHSLCLSQILTWITISLSFIIIH